MQKACTALMRLETGKKRQKEKNPSLKAREGWRWKAEPSRFVYHRYEFFSLRPSFFFLYQHDILISLKLREKFISPLPGTSETPSGKNRQKSRATYYEQVCCSLKISSYQVRSPFIIDEQDLSSENEGFWSPFIFDLPSFPQISNQNLLNKISIVSIDLPYILS